MESIPLSMATNGVPLRVMGVRAGRGLRKRLADMGLTPGVLIRVVDRQRCGPVLIDLKGSRLALGYGMAFKIDVEEDRHETGDRSGAGGEPQLGKDNVVQQPDGGQAACRQLAGGYGRKKGGHLRGRGMPPERSRPPRAGNDNHHLLLRARESRLADFEVNNATMGPGPFCTRDVSPGPGSISGLIVA